MQKGQVLAEYYESGSDYPQLPLHLPQGGPANDNNAIVYRDADHVVRALRISWFGVHRSPTTVKGADQTGFFLPLLAQLTVPRQRNVAGVTDGAQGRAIVGEHRRG